MSLLLLSSALADETVITADQALFWVNNTWMLVAAFLVFIMHLGFAALESGMSQAKNTVNILFKNLSVLSIGLLSYAAIGFNLMYPGEEFAGAAFGFAGFGIGTDAAGITAAYADGHYTYWTDFLFQAMFAATAATIVSGAVAERIKLQSFLAFAAIYVALVYPVVGMWHWGGGWLAAFGFHDFAGSTIVHAVGGFAALVGAWMLGPRIGRYDGDGIPPHSLPLAAIGALLLWFGWYGFNGGSVLSADPGPVSLVVVNTTMAAAAGVAAAMVASQIKLGHADLAMALNGALGGLVGVTAGADVLDPMTSVLVGGIAGVLCMFATLGIERIGLDDPVGAVPVHLVCGAWGTLAVGIFVPEVSLLAQVVGVAATGALCLPAAFGIFYVLDKTVGLRVSAEEEMVGLDHGEHRSAAYRPHLPEEAAAAMLALASK